MFKFIYQPFIILFIINSLYSNIKNTLTSSEALDILKTGNLNIYLTNNTINNNYLEISNYMRPFVAIISSSDIPTSVDNIFGFSIQDYFLINSIANIVNINEIESLEYSIVEYKIPLILVLGNNNSEIIKSILKNTGKSSIYKNIRGYLTPSINKASILYGNNYSDDLLNTTITLNIYQTIENIITKSEIIRNLIKSGRLDIVGAKYNPDTQKVDWLPKHPNWNELLFKNKTDISFTNKEPKKEISVKKNIYNITSTNYVKYYYITSNYITNYINQYYTNIIEEIITNVRVIEKTNLIENIISNNIKNKTNNIDNKTILKSEMKYVFSNPNYMKLSPRSPMNFSLIIKSIQDAKKCNIKLYALKIGNYYKPIKNELIFKFDNILIINGEAQIPIKWGGEDIKGKYLSPGLYALFVDIEIYDKNNILIDRIRRSPLPFKRYLITIY